MMDMKALAGLLHEIVTYARYASETGRLHTLVDDVLKVGADATAPPAGGALFTPVV
jgi:hypothetical protein